MFLLEKDHLKLRLHARVGALVAVVVRALAPQELDAGQDVLERGPEQVGRGIFALVESGRLPGSSCCRPW